MRKPVFAICGQQRRRSACASAQSDQHLYYSVPLVSLHKISSLYLAGIATSQDLLAWRRQFCKGQWKEQEGDKDRRRDGKITARNWREWGLEVPWGQRKIGNDGKVLLQRHLWCPDDLQGQGIEMRWDDLASVAAQAGLSLPWSQTLKTGFLVTRLIFKRFKVSRAVENVSFSRSYVP